jgi:hypothetical protein
MRVLRIAAAVELISLVILLVNLATVHWAPLASLLGPIHGCAYLAVIGAAWPVTRSRRARLLAFVPGIGGLLVVAAARK